MATKSEATRELLVETALRLFRERGYEKTTMRAVAAEAGVSQGNAYYYFEGKDAFVQELYRRIQVEHVEAARPLIVAGAPLAQNLRALWGSGLDVMSPYHAFGATLLSTALMGQGGTSPLSVQSQQAREVAIALVAQTLDASTGVPGGALGRQLPRLVWLAYLGVTLQWVVDSSPQQGRTRELVDGLAPVLARALSLARLPVGRGLAADVAALVERIAPSAAPRPATTEKESGHA